MVPETPTNTPVTPLPAASIMLLRDGPNSLEVLMMERHGAMGFAAGAMVFPGGKIAASDSETALTARVQPAETGEPGNPGFLNFRLGAMRELFEEAGILLASDAAGIAADPDRAGDMAARHRDEVERDPPVFAHMLDAGELYLDVDGLVHFAHWTTPEAAPKRFDTHFFAVRAPAGQQAVSDQQEAVQMAWLRPGDVLEMAKRGETILMFPTRLNLERLAASDDVDGALAAARDSKVVQVMPKPLIEDGEVYLTIPPDAGYGEVKVALRDVPEAAGANFGQQGKAAK